ncbi:MAG: rhodanese-like domain-containing protein [Bacteroidota bacterium]|nr:rhodanese-like domain-containing protein [Bacteroidota bacterium]
MRKYLFVLLAATTFVFSSCTIGQTKTLSTKLTATEFAKKIKKLPSALIIDVRTPAEFSKGHLKNSFNYNWNGSEFQNQISKLDKSKPVFVYCLSGGRSSSAANQMRSNGFKQVCELSGGIMDWRAANLPETTNTTISSTGMSK